MNDKQATTNATAKERRDELKSQIDEPFFSPRIKFDRLDSFYSSGTVPSQHTSGTIVLDALEVNWHIDEDTSRWKASTGERDRFDLRIEDGSDGTSFRSRPDAEEIYEAVVRALRNRHHSELCECPDCQIRQDM